MFLNGFRIRRRSLRVSFTEKIAAFGKLDLLLLHFESETLFTQHQLNRRHIGSLHRHELRGHGGDRLLGGKVPGVTVVRRSEGKRGKVGKDREMTQSMRCDKLILI